jgi:hypothetical protein
MDFDNDDGRQRSQSERTLKAPARPQGGCYIGRKGDFLMLRALALALLFAALPAWPADDAQQEMRRIEAALNRLTLEQQAVFQQFQMAQELRRNEDRQLLARLPTYRGTEIPTYDDRSAGRERSPVRPLPRTGGAEAALAGHPVRAGTAGAAAGGDPGAGAACGDPGAGAACGDPGAGAHVAATRPLSARGAAGRLGLRLEKRAN